LRKQQQHAPPTQPGALRAAGRRRHAPACVDGLCQCRRVSKELRREDVASNRVVSALVVGCIARRCLSQRHFMRACRCELLRRVRLSRTCPTRFNSYMSCGLLASSHSPQALLQMLRLARHHHQQQRRHHLQHPHVCSSYSNIRRCPRYLSSAVSSHAIAHYASTATSTRRHHLHPKPSITSPPSRANSPRRVLKLPSRAPALGSRKLGNSATRQLGNRRLCNSATRQQRPRLSSTAHLLAFSTRSTLRLLATVRHAARSTTA
jgi:hypothetical protein